jgi:basic membrane lipoprotein Med (substrate-binding protein (PBP1-ABC) superfamily)
VRTPRPALLLLAASLAASGCGEPPGTAADAGFRVALLTPGSIRDAGWNQSAYEGLERIRDELGAEIAHQQTATPQDFETGFRDFAARGYDLVFGHGFEFQDAAARVGGEYPDTVFITTSGSTVLPNVAPIVFEMEQATYVLGYVGALVSKRGRVGAVGGVEIPSVASTFMAFEAGARAARGGVTTSVAYVGSWTDVSAAREATLAQISQGVDVLIHNANEAAAGFFQAVRDSDGVLAFGTNRDQNHLAPERILASATLHVPAALLLVAREVSEGRFEARSIRFGLKEGVVGIAWNEPLVAGLPAGVKARAEELAREITAGALEVPRLDF